MVILFYSNIAVGIFIGSTQPIYSTKAYQQLDAITAEHSTEPINIPRKHEYRNHCSFPHILRFSSNFDRFKLKIDKNWFSSDI